MTDQRPLTAAERSAIAERVEIHLGDCTASMRAMPDQSVHTCVTSPPYFGLRDYGMDGQIGLEDTPDAFVARLVEVFREVRRVLRDDGTLWLNLGDRYAASQSTNGGCSDKSTLGGGGGSYRTGSKNEAAYSSNNPRNASGIGLKHKDLIGIPWRVAFALQADGWYLRQDIIWHKPNPMPESVRDRCTKAHEYIFLLSKGPKYYFDHEAVKEAASCANDPRRYNGKGSPLDGTLRNDIGVHSGRIGGGETRNRRSVWTVTAKPYKGAHFATFPPDLIEPCILAGAPRGGVVLDPFGGSGTTAGVAIRNGRRAALCELNPEYAALVPDRIRSIAVRRVEEAYRQPDLFVEQPAPQPTQEGLDR